MPELWLERRDLDGTAPGPVMKNQGTVCIGYCYGTREEEFVDSLRDLQIFDKQHNGLVQHEVKIRGLYIEENRNNVVREFLTTGDDWLVSLDTDIHFRPEMIYALYDVADPKTRPVVSGIYFGRLAQGRLVPIWFIDPKNGKYTTVKQVEPDAGQPQALDAIGMGFCIIHRSVFEELAVLHAKDHWTWFGRDETFNGDDGQTHHLGEDLSFCRRVRAAGFPIYGHAGIQVGHIKKHALSYELWLREEHPEEWIKHEYKDGCVVGPRQTNGAVEHVGAK